MKSRALERGSLLIGEFVAILIVYFSIYSMNQLMSRSTITLSTTAGLNFANWVSEDLFTRIELNSNHIQDYINAQNNFSCPVQTNATPALRDLGEVFCEPVNGGAHTNTAGAYPGLIWRLSCVNNDCTTGNVEINIELPDTSGNNNPRTMTFSRVIDV